MLLHAAYPYRGAGYGARQGRVWCQAGPGMVPGGAGYGAARRIRCADESPSSARAPGAGWPADKQTRIEQYIPGPSHPYFTLETMYCPPLPATYWHWATGF